jgi:hypothetical protein
LEEKIKYVIIILGSDKMEKQTNGFIDNMKKESKKIIPLIYFSLILFFLLIVAYFLQFSSDFFEEISLKDIILRCSFVLIIFCLALYLYLYAIKYDLKVDDSVIHLKTLFTKVIIKLDEIDSYTYKKYTKKSEFYIFCLIVKGKKYIISTRYVEEMKTILDQHQKS